MKNKIILIAILLISFFLCNYINIFGTNWFKHPDETGYYVLAKELYVNHRLFIEIPLNTSLQTNSFTPAGLFYNGKFAVPSMAYGMYFFTALGFWLGNNGPFFIPPIFALISIVATYLIVNKLFDKNTAILSASLWGLSAPLIYWSNSIFGNIAGLSFYLLGVYFLIKIIDDLKIKSNYLYSGIFLALSIFTRYEYLFFVFCILLAFIHLTKNNFPKLLTNFVLIILPIIISCLFVLKLNSIYFGSPLSFSYTAPTSEVSNNVTSNSPVGLNKYFVSVKRIYDRFFTQDLNPNITRLNNNFSRYVANIFFLSVLSIVGLVSVIFKGGKTRVFFIGILVPTLLWTYDTLGGYHWGEDFSSISGVYVRYFPITYLLLIILFSLFIFKSHLNRFLKILLIIMVVSQNFLLLFNKIDGLNVLLTEKKSYYEVNKYIENNSNKKTIVVSNLYNKYIISRTVLNYSLINENKSEVILSITEDLLRDNYRILLAEDITHKATYINFKEMLPTSNIKIIENKKYPDIYELIR